jgi:hypothetical protein
MCTLLENTIRVDCARVMEIMLGLTQYRCTDLVALRQFLGLFLFCVHKNSSLWQQGFEYDAAYLELYCHSIRHDRIFPVGGDFIRIKNSYEGKAVDLTINKKFYLKVCVSIVNIFYSFVFLETDVFLPQEIIRCVGLDAKLDKKVLLEIPE